MKPIRLEISGLQSFSKKQIIDFDELTSLGLFGIFGETGSGKSTILDAMIFAIFDEIPRTMGSKGKSIRPCLNQDSDAIEVYFKFSLGENIFEVNRCYKKKYSKKGEEKFEQANPVLKINGDVVADTVKNVDSKISEYFGINVNDFTRSVVLPQGKFSDFLKLKGSDKMGMLENIFDLEKYGTQMSDKISSRLNVLKEEISSLENQIKGKGDFSLELISSLKSNLEIKNNQHKELISQKTCLTKEFEELNQVKILFEKLEVYQSELLNLEEIREKISKDKERVYKHELAISLKSMIEELNSIQKNIIQNADEIRYFEVSLGRENALFSSEKERENSLENSLDTLNSKLSEKKVDYNTLEALRKAEEYLKAIELKEKFLKDSQESNQNINDEINFLKVKLEKNEIDLIDVNREFEMLDKIEPHQIESLQKEILGLQSRLMLLKEKSSDKRESETELEKTLNSKKDIYLKFNSIQETIKDLQKKNLKNYAYELTQHLKHGENCPVCGSKEHPNPARDNQNIDLSILEKNMDSKIILEKQLLELDIKIDYLQSKINGIGSLEEIKILQNSLNEKDNILKALKERENKLFLKDKELSNSIATLKLEVINGNENIVHREVILKNTFEKIKLYKNEILELREHLSYLKFDNLKELTLDSVSKTKSILEEMDREYRTLIATKESLEFNLKEIKNNLFSILNKIQKINLKLVSLKEKKLNFDSNFKEKNSYLEEVSISKGFKSKDEILFYILSNNSYEILKNEIFNFENNYIKYTHLKDELISTIGEREFNIDRWKEITHKLEALSKEEKLLVKDITECSSNLTRILLLAEEAKELLKQIEVLILKQDDLLLLQKRFKGRKFVNFLARKRLDYITYVASKRLQKITRGRYLLKVDNNCDFIIVDTFNSNHSRECSTLSGGETFIVSLVLALALSGQLQLKGKIQLEFFFLDEGFGTLDSTLLDRVIEILEEIRWKEKMKIGIISHVEDLKIRIPRRLEVSSAIPGEIGSTIRLI